MHATSDMLEVGREGRYNCVRLHWDESKPTELATYMYLPTYIHVDMYVWVRVPPFFFS